MAKKRSVFNFWTKKNPVAGMFVVGGGGAKSTPRNYEQLAKEGYEKNNVVFSSVNLVADVCSQAKWVLKQKTKEGAVPVENHPILDLLNKPNPTNGKTEFIRSVIAYRLLSGNSYINAVGKGAGEDGTIAKYNFQPTELWSNRPDKFKVIPGNSGIAGYEYQTHGRKKTFPADQITGESNVLHWKTFHPTNDFYGMSAIEAAASGIDIYNHSLEWNNAFFANGARPSGALMWKGDGNMPDSTYNMLKKEVDELFSGSSNNGRPLLLGQMEWVQFSLSPKDMDFILAKDTTAKDIARVFGVSPLLLNIGSDATFSNVAEARLALYEDTALPLMANLSCELNTWLIPRYGDESLYLSVDFSDSPALELKREKMWERARTADFLTVNEKRKIVGYKEVEGGDDVLIQSSMIPLTFEIDDSKSGEPSSDGKSLSNGMEFKILNGTRRAEQREQAIQDRLMKTLERPFSLRVNQVINKYVNIAAREAGKSENGNAPVDSLLAKMDDDLLKIYEPHYRRTMEQMGGRILEGLKSVGDHILEYKEETDIFLTAINNWIDKNAASRVAFVSQTTKDSIKAAISEGIAESLTGSEMAKRIREKTGGSIAKNRSVVISRTETHNASQQASLEAADSSGLELKKVWIAAEDERTRETHIATDNESHSNPLFMDDEFQVGGDSMIAPGGGSDPAENINCRCVMGYRT
jgi:HK97 family phage portal protein